MKKLFYLIFLPFPSVPVIAWVAELVRNPEKQAFEKPEMASSVKA
jgi:hypothetical protein